MNSIWDRVWGGPCLSNLDCTDYISICFISTPGIVGVCRMETYVLFLLMVLPVILVFLFISCIYCPSCCFYSICSDALDSVFYCCRNKGYLSIPETTPQLSNPSQYTQTMSRSFTLP
ncbi:uncharacterized protein LOC111701625 [Eurytemora carolleeae]|uniref:uncharacterized protein LOC111701625 n=1 Tax=Eurytemora carolleeae TaxID=1294199 RepID=UPI000C76EF6B|nr:uncharacterized protein LOC111701625 [Eurytemora carolleeae]|eukprot:XP_023328762.1 uncharacterized protein LOC111701625 [Eurytemora affinis]